MCSLYILDSIVISKDYACLTFSSGASGNATSKILVVFLLLRISFKDKSGHGYASPFVLAIFDPFEAGCPVVSRHFAPFSGGTFWEVVDAGRVCLLSHFSRGAITLRPPYWALVLVGMAKPGRPGSSPAGW